MKKKIIAGLLAAMMLFTAGCGGAGTSSADTAAGGGSAEEAAAVENASGSAEAAAESSGEVPTIIWWNVGSLPTNADAWEEEVNKYLESEIGVRVDYRAIPWGDWPTKHNTIINSGEYFDIMFVDVGLYNQFASMGAFADLTDLLPTAAPKLQEFIPEEIWQGVTTRDGIFAVPTYKDCARTSFFVFDKQYIDKYNIDYESIDTMEELDSYFRTIKAGEGDSYYPLQMTTALCWNGLFENYDTLGGSLDAVGVRLDDEDYQVVCTLEQPDIQENLNWLHTWYMDGITNPDANVQTETNRQRPFFKAVGWPGAVASWAISEGVDEYVATKVFGPSYTTESIQGSLNCISANSEHKEAALKLLEFVNTDHKARDMFAYGIEGENFEYVEDNVVRLLDDVFSAISTYSQASFFTMSTVEGNQKDQYEEIKEQNEAATSTALLGFTLNMEPIMDELAACRTVWSKYSNDLTTGASDPNEVIPQIIKEMKSVGLDTVMEEAQRQVDEFLGK
ncbi:MAG TPA: ABC transporter substrate-binding protein [Candidatus Eisenbergiella merdavium]|uniref:ABC transporter substrate-binding protein n=1 Tax=Candidatus Eisenbergiella merdavium TaxID=2838551 RepID=A0A9D2NHI0_9FIRM|nr:ABC transporter substrate-binding protein [Candidatus Eisenbergiella merdavium]